MVIPKLEWDDFKRSESEDYRKLVRQYLGESWLEKEGEMDGSWRKRCGQSRGFFVVVVVVVVIF